MSKLKPDDVVAVKAKGFLRNRGTDKFSGRILAKGTVFSAQNFKDISTIAEKFGDGKLIATSRQAVEITGIDFDDIPKAMEFAKEHDLIFGGTGNKIRPVTACKGPTCVYGNFDTQRLAAEIHEKFFEGYSSVALPHKFKIGVGGCPNSCMKPSLNDFGVEGHKVPLFDAELCRGCKVCSVEKFCPMKAATLKDNKLNIDKEVCIDCGVCSGKCPFKAVARDTKVVYKIYVGGTWGKHTRMGTPLSYYVEETQIMPILEKTLLWFKENANTKERLGMAIDRIGFENFEKAISTDDLLDRKEEILSR